MENTVYCHTGKHLVPRKNIVAMTVIPETGARHMTCLSCLNNSTLIIRKPERAAVESGKLVKKAVSEETLKRRKAADAAKRRVARGYPKYPNVVEAAWGRG